jgi:hypothetical protein
MMEMKPKQFKTGIYVFGAVQFLLCIRYTRILNCVEIHFHHELFLKVKITSYNIKYC